MDMNRICCYLCLLWLLGIGFTVEAARRLRYMVQFHGFDCINRWSIVKNWSCVIAEDGTINTELTVLEPIPEVWINCKMTVLRPPNTEMVIFNTTLNICKLLSSGSTANRLVTSIYQTMLKATNLVPQCPIRKGHLYFHNMASLEKLPAFMPEMDFKTYIKFFKPNSTENSEVFLNGSLIETNRLRQKLGH